VILSHEDRGQDISSIGSAILRLCFEIERNIVTLDCILPLEFDAFFSSEELAWIGRNQARFYSCWTRKEAVNKATGKGVSYPLLAISALDDSCMIEGHQFMIADLPINEPYGYVISYAGIECETVEKLVDLALLFDRLSKR
jgi:hypothetical protein